MISSGLLKAGMGVLVLGLRLAMVQSALTRANKVIPGQPNQLRKEGVVISIVGVVVLLMGFFGSYMKFSLSEDETLYSAGAAIMLLGLLQLLQWLCQNHQRTVSLGLVWSVTLLGCILTVISAVLSVTGR